MQNILHDPPELDTTTTTYETQVAVGTPPNLRPDSPLLAWDRCPTIWRTIYSGDDQQQAHKTLRDKRDAPGFPVVRVVTVEQEIGTGRVTRRVTETIQHRTAAPEKRVRRRK